LSPVGDVASAVENVSAAYSDTTVAPHEYFDQTRQASRVDLAQLRPAAKRSRAQQRAAAGGLTLDSVTLTFELTAAPPAAWSRTSLIPAQ
jgi:hypothetical protein